VARFTEAADTPGTLSRAFSTRATQEAQVMPSTWSSTRRFGTSYPALRTAAARAPAATSAVARTVACSVARLTATLCTPGSDVSAFSTRSTHEAQVMPSMGSVKSLGRLRAAVELMAAISGWGWVRCALSFSLAIMERSSAFAASPMHRHGER
jgi:hypothetical protein